MGYTATNVPSTKPIYRNVPAMYDVDDVNVVEPVVFAVLSTTVMTYVETVSFSIVTVKLFCVHVPKISRLMYGNWMVVDAVPRW